MPRILRAPGGSSPIQRMLHDDWLLAYYGMDRNCLKIESSECTMLWSLCLLRFKKNIRDARREAHHRDRTGPRSAAPPPVIMTG